ncbi:MAG: type I methionyl aminopeptidase [Oscillospiraceae bacterium]|nr:type I methionyl aminopeptidase [Ruminococcus sp.]MBQ7002644.1 type I methionyl aminopeptidase [Oscillospiraceae bacterium]MBQ7013997.1 type I methionyl aminopeptidase [Oscillospiraceae bacterium]
MSITIKSKTDLMKMREAGRIAGRALQLAGQSVRPGMTTKELDKIIHDYIVGCGAYPSFLGLYGFPGSACISINDEIIHGIPSAKRKLQAGDIVSVDLGAQLNGFHSDTCATFAVGKISAEAQALLDVTKAALEAGIAKAVVDARVSDISGAVEEYCTSRGYGVVREYCGHGIGREVHEAPEIPNYVTPGRNGVKLQAGMVICIEPMINAGKAAIRQCKDGWTVRTRDGSLSAHFEHEVAITPDGPVIMTDPN